MIPLARRARARRRGDEDVRQHARGARTARRPHRRARRGGRRRDARRRASSWPTRCRGSRRCTRARADVLVHRADVRDRPRHGVRDRARDRAQAARDLQDRRRAADGDGPRARAGRRARSALPRLGDRLAGRDAARPCRRPPSAIQAMGATLVASGTAADAVTGADTGCPCPRPIRRCCRPLLSVVPGQLFA